MTAAKPPRSERDDGDLVLQDWLVMAFVGTDRMAEAGTGSQICQAGIVGAAMLATVFGLLGTLIQGVFAFVRARRVAKTGASRQVGDAGVFSSAILAIAVIVEWLLAAF